jgi:hypothetical protein
MSRSTDPALNGARNSMYSDQWVHLIAVMEAINPFLSNNEICRLEASPLLLQISLVFDSSREKKYLRPYSDKRPKCLCFLNNETTEVRVIKEI